MIILLYNPQKEMLEDLEQEDVDDGSSDGEGKASRGAPKWWASVAGRLL
jgi:hypothetical protein